MPTGWRPPGDWVRVRTLDAHTGGEPLRIVLDAPDVPGASMLDKRRWAEGNLDELRRLLIGEPRGHADMYGALPTAAVTPDGHLGVLFLHNGGWSTMCGHGVVALVHAGLRCGLLPAQEGDNEIRLDTPAGRVVAHCRITGEHPGVVRFEGIPSFVAAREVAFAVPGHGEVVADVAFGGAYYAFVSAERLGVELVPAAADEIVAAGRAVTAAVDGNVALEHPSGARDLDFLYGTVLIGPDPESGTHSRHACVFADGELDRSPTGTGLAARAALLHAAGGLREGETIRISGIVDSAMAVRILRTERIGAAAAVVPEITGTAHVTGLHEFVRDPEDLLGAGFFLQRGR